MVLIVTHVATTGFYRESLAPFGIGVMAAWVLAALTWANCMYFTLRIGAFDFSKL